MLRKIISLVVLFLVAYLGTHYFIRWRHTVTDDVTKIGRLVECHPNDLRSITIHQLVDGKPEDLHFERVDQPAPGLPAVTALARWEWKYAGPLDGEAEPVALRRIASTICELYDPIHLRPEDMRPNEEARRHAVSVDAKIIGPGGLVPLKFEFGPVSADHGNIIRFSGPAGTQVLRIPDHFLVASSLSPEKFRNLRVAKLDADIVERVVLHIAGRERFTLERAGAGWKVLLAGKEKGSGSEEAGRFLNRISTLQALGVDPGHFSAAECAALPANAEVELRGLPGLAETLRFVYGRAGELIACSSERAVKFHVHHDFVPFLDVPLKAVIARQRAPSALSINRERASVKASG